MGEGFDNDGFFFAMGQPFKEPESRMKTIAITWSAKQRARPGAPAPSKQPAAIIADTKVASMNERITCAIKVKISIEAEVDAAHGDAGPGKFDVGCQIGDVCARCRDCVLPGIHTTTKVLAGLDPRPAFDLAG